MHDEDAATDPVEIAPWSQRLHDGPANRAFAAQQLMRQHAVIERTADYTIFRTGEAEGWILLYDMRSQEIGYAVGYRTCRWPWMNRPVTQCIVGRYPATCHVLAMTRRIFFGYLPQSFGTIMSDSRDEPSGYDFWVARMSAAIGLNLRVGVADMNVPALDWFDPAGNLCFESLDPPAEWLWADAEPAGDPVSDLRSLTSSPAAHRGRTNTARAGNPAWLEGCPAAMPGLASS